LVKHINVIGHTHICTHILRVKFDVIFVPLSFNNIFDYIIKKMNSKLILIAYRKLELITRHDIKIKFLKRV